MTSYIFSGFSDTGGNTKWCLTILSALTTSHLQSLLIIASSIISSIYSVITEWPYSSMQLHSLRRTFSGTQLKFWIGLILHMLHYKMACIHSLFRVMTIWLHPKNNAYSLNLSCETVSVEMWNHCAYIRNHIISWHLQGLSCKFNWHRCIGFFFSPLFFFKCYIHLCSLGTSYYGNILI